MFNLCVKPEILFFRSHLALQTQSESFLCGHDSSLALLPFLLIILPQYARHSNQFNLISWSSICISNFNRSSFIIYLVLAGVCSIVLLLKHDFLSFRKHPPDTELMRS